MPPADNSVPTPTPPAPEPPKQSFWAKLFGKKPSVAPVIPPEQSNTPQPQLDEPSPSAPSAAPVVGVDVAPPQLDTVTGLPQAPKESAPDMNNEVTAPSLDVPPSLASPAEGESPTLAVPPSVSPDQSATPNAYGSSSFGPSEPSQPASPSGGDSTPSSGDSSSSS